jgi:hypothetical protein
VSDDDAKRPRGPKPSEAETQPPPERGNQEADSTALSEVRKGMTLMPSQPPPHAEVDKVGGLPPADPSPTDSAADQGASDAGDAGPPPDSGE